MKNKISNYLRKKDVKRFSIFFALAFLFLIFSKLSNDYKQNIALKVELFNLDEEIVVEYDSLNKIIAFVEAKGFTLLPYLFQDSKTIMIDAKKDVVIRDNEIVLEVQRQKYRIEEALGSPYKLLTLNPDSLILRYSEMATKYVDVVINKDFKYALGFDLLGELNMDIDSVKLVGPMSSIENINSINTELLALTDIKMDINQVLNLDISQLKDVQVVPEFVTVTGDVERFTEGAIEVPVVIKNAPNDVNINYFPKTVTVSYYIDLNRFKSINESNFKVECDFNEVNNGQQFMIPKIVVKPDFVKRSSIKQKRVDFIKL